MHWALFLAVAEFLLLCALGFRQWRTGRALKREQAAPPVAPVSFGARQRAALRLEDCVCVCRHERLDARAASQDGRN